MTTNNKFKKLKLTFEQLIQIIDVFLKDLNGVYKIQDKPNNLKQIIIEIPGQKPAMLNIYETNRGITLNPKVGVNQDLSTNIAEKIFLLSQKVRSSSQSFDSITEELFDEFIQYLKESDIIVTDESKKKEQILLKLTSKDNYTLTVTWYKTTHKVLIQGRTTNLFDDVMLWFADKVCKNSKEIIDIIFKSYKDIINTRINFPDNLIDTKLKKEMGCIYNNEKIVKNIEKKWLKISLFLCDIDMELPDYYPAIACCFKVIEGLLRRICIVKFGFDSFNKKTRGFAQFNGQNGKLKENYKTKISSQKAIEYIEDLFAFIQNERHQYQHSNGITPAILESKEDAQEILKKTIDLIKRCEPFVKEFFK